MYNINIMGISEGREREKETGEIFEVIMTENFPNLCQILANTDITKEYFTAVCDTLPLIS